MTQRITVNWHHDTPRPLTEQEVIEEWHRVEAAIAYALHETDISPSPVAEMVRPPDLGPVSE